VTLNFPNQSRSFDDGRQAVRFTGYDGMFEVRFFIEAEALSASNGTARDGDAVEAACLLAFDAFRRSIYDVARSIYDGRRRESYTLTSADLRQGRA
jgi:hypothetical protein